MPFSIDCTIVSIFPNEISFIAPSVGYDPCPGFYNSFRLKRGPLMINSLESERITKKMNFLISKCSLLGLINFVLILKEIYR
jgi:hypothetical protein